MDIALAAIPRPNKMIASLIINPADGKPIDEELLALAFADEITQAQAKYDLLYSQTIVARMKAGSDAMVALWARNKVRLGPAWLDDDLFVAECQR